MIEPDTFTPVGVRARHDGWTPARQRAFVVALEERGCVAHAAAAVGMSAESAYRLRRRDDAEGFARAWDKGLRLGARKLLDLAWVRAIEGVAVPVFYRGEQVGERRTYSDRLLIRLLDLHADRFDEPEPEIDPVEDRRALEQALIVKLEALVAGTAISDAEEAEFAVHEPDLPDLPPASAPPPRPLNRAERRRHERAARVRAALQSRKAAAAAAHRPG